jgi:hypothetical protein
MMAGSCGRPRYRLPSPAAATAPDRLPASTSEAAKTRLRVAENRQQEKNSGVEIR